MTKNFDAAEQQFDLRFPEMECVDDRVRAGRRFARLAAGHLYFSFAFTTLKESGAATVHAQAHFPAQPAPPLEDARISHPDENQGRPCRHLAPPRQGPQAGVSKARLP